MIRRTVSAFALSVAAAAGALAADRNGGLTLGGNVSGRNVVKRPCINLPLTEKGRTETHYTPMIEIVAENRGDRAIIHPLFTLVPAEIRFQSEAEETAIVKRIGTVGTLRMVDEIPDDPSDLRFRILEPGETFHILRTFSIVDRSDCGNVPTEFTDSRAGVFRVDAADARRLLERARLKQVFSLRPDESQTDLLRAFADRWKRFGKLPLNDRSEFHIETDAFRSNSDWIRKEDLP